MDSLDKVLEGKPRDEQGKFVSTKPDEKPIVTQPDPSIEAKGEPEKVNAATPAEKPTVETIPDEPPEIRGLKSAHMAEKTKRKEYEKRLQELEAKYAEAIRPPAPDPRQDPDAYRQYADNARIDERVDLSHEVAKERHEDYEDVMGVGNSNWNQACQSDPTLYQRAILQKFPAEWAYQQLKRSKVLESLGDPDAWMKTKEAEIEARLIAKYANKTQIPNPSLANANGSGRVESTPTFSGPTPLNSIFRR